MDLYPESDYKSGLERLSWFITDFLLGCPSRALAVAMESQDQDVWLYRYCFFSNQI